MKKLALFLVSVIGLAAATGCPEPAPKVCDPGGVQHCPCLAGGEGVQNCADDGTRWLECTCSAADAGGGSDAARDAAVGQDHTGASDAAHDAAIDASVDPCTGGAVTATVQQIAQGQVATGTRVHLVGVVATSQQFLESKSAADRCLYALFVSAPSIATAQAYSGLLVSGYGNNATIPDGGSRSYCAELGQVATGSPVPDDTQPGDVLSLVGIVERTLNANCGNTSGDAQVGQLRLSNVCGVQKAGAVAVPAPAVIGTVDVAKLASATDQAFHDQWSGARVKIVSVSAELPLSPATCSSGANFLGAYGILTLTSSGLQVGDKLYYRSLGAHSGDLCRNEPLFCSPGATYPFTSIQGLSYLNYCTWGLQPNDKCADFAPRSEDCTSDSCAPY